MLQFMSSFLPMMAIIAAAFMLACKVKHSGNCLEQMISDFGWFIDKSPAQVAFFMFSISAAIAVALIACAFSKVSNQFIITLDILFILSSMLLILFHQLKEHTLTSL